MTRTIRRPEPPSQGETPMTDKRIQAPQPDDAGNASTLLPMLVAGLVLITVGMTVIAIVF